MLERASFASSSSGSSTTADASSTRFSSTNRSAAASFRASGRRSTNIAAIPPTGSSPTAVWPTIRCRSPARCPISTSPMSRRRRAKPCSARAASAKPASSARSGRCGRPSTTPFLRSAPLSNSNPLRRSASSTRSKQEEHLRRADGRSTLSLQRIGDFVRPLKPKQEFSHHFRDRLYVANVADAAVDGETIERHPCDVRKKQLADERPALLRQAVHNQGGQQFFRTHEQIAWFFRPLRRLRERFDERIGEAMIGRRDIAPDANEDAPQTHIGRTKSRDRRRQDIDLVGEPGIVDLVEDHELRGKIDIEIGDRGVGRAGDVRHRRGAVAPPREKIEGRRQDGAAFVALLDLRHCKTSKTFLTASGSPLAAGGMKPGVLISGGPFRQ